MKSREFEVKDLIPHIGLIPKAIPKVVQRMFSRVFERGSETQRNVV